MAGTFRRLALGAALAAAASGSPAQTEIKVSYQPALYWSLPYYVASEKGWWGEVGLKPVFSTFPAGVPQIAASASKSWDVGGIGSVPAVLGAARYNLLTIGLTNDESVGNALMASGANADGFVKNPQSIKGQTIVLTANSTGDFAVQSCLAKWGLKKADVTIKSMGQAEIISAMSSKNADLGGLWAPNIYTLEEKAGRAGDLLGQGRRRDRARRARGARRLRQGAAAERRALPRRVPQDLELDERQPARGDRDDEEVLRDRRRDDQRGVDEEGVRHAADLRPRRASSRS